MPLVLFPQGCIYRKRMIYALESAGRPWRAAYHSQSLAGVQAAVAAGLGISLLPAFACLPEHGILGAAQGLAPAPHTELAIVGEDVYKRQDKGGEKPPRRKSKVSCATFIGAG